MEATGRARSARVLALCEGPIPSAELGVHAVFAALARAGECELRTGSSKAPRREDLAWADVLVLVRGAAPAERRLLLEARRLGRRVATYMDDDLESVPAGARSGVFYASPLVKDNVAFLVRSADDLLVCSERLGAVLAKRHGRPWVLMRQPRPPEAEGAEPVTPVRSSGTVRIGFLGSVDHAGFFDGLLGEPLRRIRSELGDRIDFVFCGARPAIARELGAEHHEFVLGLAAWRARARSLGVQVGLAPMPDTAFHRCKYWNKFLEYGSLGIAGIYSAVPPNADVVADRATGLLVPNRPEAWLDALHELVADPALRERLAENARADAEARFSERALLPGWRRSLAPLLAHRAPEVPAAEVRVLGGPVRFVRDRLAVYGPLGLAERALGRGASASPRGGSRRGPSSRGRRRGGRSAARPPRRRS
jgi:glycosyltransferase involved in cell wall biosynthesis